MIKKIVIKLGSSSLTNEAKQLSSLQMIELVRQIYQLYSLGHQIILVSSGAIAAGKELFPVPTDSNCLPSKQMLASIGQVKLMQTWSELFSIYGICIGQVLLTREDVKEDKRAANAENTLLTLLSHRVIPVVNENDTVATEEIRFGDNDNLSALVAHLVNADLLIMLTDQEGLYTKDPRFHPEATLISSIEKIDETLYAYAQDTVPEGVGTGGMTTKVQAAKIATQKGIATVIASSKIPNVLIDLIAGKKIGTYFSV